MEKPLVGHIVGRYRIERRLGAGGMGEVYLGVQPQIGSHVAIKVLTAESAQNEQMVERFFTEARAVNTIRHDNIVNIIDLDRLADGRPFIVMEYLDGVSLAQAIKQRGALPLGGLTRVAGETLEALAAAHRHFVIHRDLKPDNLQITRSGRTKVLDFGIAKLLGDPSVPAITQTGMLLGTPHYMAPEQISAGTIDARTDLYALGVILYEGATGRKPFDGQTLFELFSRHVKEPPQPPRQLRPELSPAYEAVILRALEKDPARRFGSAKEMHAYLHEAAKSLPPAAQEGVNLADVVGSTHFAPQDGPTMASGVGVVASGGVLAGALDGTVASWQGSAPAQTIPQGSVGVTLPPAPVTGAQPAAAWPVPSLASPVAAPETREESRGGGAGKVVALVLGALLLFVVGGGLGVYFLERSRARSTTVAAREGTATPPRLPPLPNAASATAGDDVEAVGAAPSRPRVKRTTRKRPQRASPTPVTAPVAPPSPATGTRGGVHLGAGVRVSGGVKIISETVRARFSEPLRGNARAFDVVAFYPRARELARRVLKDAELHEINAPNVRADTGLVDLKLTSGAEVDYRFRSRLASKLIDESLPPEKRGEVQCMVFVYVRPTKVLVVRRGDEKCKGRIVAPPNRRFHPKKAWAVALQQCKAGKRRVADLMWDKDGWYLNFGSDAGSCTIHKKDM